MCFVQPQKMFTGKSAGDEAPRARLMEACSKILKGEMEDTDWPVPGAWMQPEAFDAYLHKCPEAYVQRSSPRRFLKQAELYHQIMGTESVACNVETKWELKTFEKLAGLNNESQSMITIAAPNVVPKPALKRIVQYINYVIGMDIKRVHVDVVDGNVTMFRLVVGDTAVARMAELEVWPFSPLSSSSFCW
jgi:hypothetical protein